MTEKPPPGQRRFAPREQGAKLIDPPWGELPSDWRENAAIRARSRCEIAGRSLHELAADTRQEFLAAALQYTRAYRDVALPAAPAAIFVGGHQPEQFHAGVWLKNAALARLAEGQGGVAVHLLIDSDAVKQHAIRVPGGSLAAPQIADIPYDSPAAERPHEERSILDPACWASFGTRVVEQIAPLVPMPLVRDYWPRVLERSKATRNLGACLSQARHQLEAAWGLQSLELPQSTVCGLEGFLRVTVHLLAQLPEFQQVHNEAIAAYRRVYRLRSANHPFPQLIRDGDWLEAPFWVWTAADPQRRRLFVRPQGKDVLLSDRAAWEWTVPRVQDADAAMRSLRQAAEWGIKLRSRALTTTLFARLLLADLFVHGLGGGQYDQVTDQVIQRFFGVEPPKFAVITGTLHLPDLPPAPPADAENQARQRLRELHYHPERFLAAATDLSPPQREEAQRMAAEKAHWIARAAPRGQARRRCHAIRELNESLQAYVAGVRRQGELQQRSAVDQAAASTALRSREFAFCLHPADGLRHFLLDFPRQGANL